MDQPDYSEVSNEVVRQELLRTLFEDEVDDRMVDMLTVFGLAFAETLTVTLSGYVSGPVSFTDFTDDQGIIVYPQQTDWDHLSDFVEVKQCEEAGTCSICLDGIEGSMAELRGCAHKFHEECIYKWYEQSATCPLCRWSAKTGQDV